MSDVYHWKVHRCIEYRYRWKLSLTRGFHKDKGSSNDVAKLFIPSVLESKCAEDNIGGAYCDHDYEANCFVAVIEKTESSQYVRVWVGKVLKAIKSVHDAIAKHETHWSDSHEQRKGLSTKYQPALLAVLGQNMALLRKVLSLLVVFPLSFRR